MARAPHRPVTLVVRLLRPHAAAEGRAFALGAGLSVATLVLQVLRPWPLKWLVDGLGGAGRASPAFLAGAYVALSALAALAAYAQGLTLTSLSNRVVYRFREYLFAHVLRQPLAYHQGREVGELMTRIVYDTSRLRRGVTGLLVRVVQPLALFVASMGVLLWIDPRLAGVLLLGGGVALIMMRRRGRRIGAVARTQRAKEGRLAALVGSELAAVRELQAFGVASSAVSARFAARNRRSLRQELKLQRLSLGLSLRVEVAIAASVALAMWIGADRIAVGGMGAGDLVLFLSYALALRGPFADFSQATARLGRTVACAERLERIVRRAPGPSDAPDAQGAAGIRGALQFEDVALRMPKRRRNDRKWSLDGIACALPAGQRIAIVGGNGAGKSTLLSLVLRLADPTRGRIMLDGRDLREYSVESLRRHISIVFQDSALTGVSVRDNIALGLPDATLEAVQAAAGRADVARFIEALPDGYETIVRRGGDLFSGGERQRIALARALLRDGALWLLDEPTTGLDHAAALALTDRLLNLTRGRSVLWVTHDPALLARMDWVLALEEGRVQYSGPAAAFNMPVAAAATADAGPDRS
ncbi:MAG: hypothetical protein C0503_03305 [Gemmatimonas sp.]|nr:hypothetical protein [Gemmatimonas sp.]